MLGLHFHYFRLTEWKLHSSCWGLRYSCMSLHRQRSSHILLCHSSCLYFIPTYLSLLGCKVLSYNYPVIFSSVLLWICLAFSIRYFLLDLFSNTTFSGQFLEGSLFPNRKRAIILRFSRPKLELISKTSSSSALLLSAPVS